MRNTIPNIFGVTILHILNDEAEVSLLILDLVVARYFEEMISRRILLKLTHDKALIIGNLLQVVHLLTSLSNQVLLVAVEQVSVSGVTFS